MRLLAAQLRQSQENEANNHHQRARQSSGGLGLAQESGAQVGTDENAELAGRGDVAYRGET